MDGTRINRSPRALRLQTPNLPLLKSIRKRALQANLLSFLRKMFEGKRNIIA